MYRQVFPQKVIAETIKKDKSVVSRELRRNRNDRGEYGFTHAQMLAGVRKERLGRERTFTGEVKNRINRYMRKWQWSPEQIVGYCRLKGYAMVPWSASINISARTRQRAATCTGTAATGSSTASVPWAGISPSGTG